MRLFSSYSHQASLQRKSARRFTPPTAATPRGHEGRGHHSRGQGGRGKGRFQAHGQQQFAPTRASGFGQTIGCAAAPRHPTNGTTGHSAIHCTPRFT
ncbi:unnamed protein product [Cuscuta epithymum]|uniref:Uncharacterized protein n=1 Tax=Cuscuta epithymum TaxID=186058 RepID=A0AAV0DUY5_9ASTE|nr:unnamed protein product [Cuscuta epithymum]